MKQPLFPSKLLIAILIIFTVGQISYPQNTITLGFKTGIVYNENIISGESIASYSNGYNKPGFEIGMTTGFFRSRYFMLLAGAGFLQRGMNYNKGEFVYAINSGKTTVNYLSFVFLPAYRFENKFINLNIYAGSRIELRLNYDDGGLRYLYYRLNTANIGLTTGIGFEKEITKGVNITADFRYSRDFTGFESDATNVGYGLNNFINSSFDFLLGLNFNIGGNKKLETIK
jgi:hypothetical protein